MDPRVQKVVELIEENYHHELPLSELARLVNLSESRLRHLFTKEVGMTPAQCRKQRRIRKAIELAANTFLNKKQVMSEVGISDKSHFSRDFKRIAGVTFTKFRAHYYCKNHQERSAEGLAAKSAAK